MHPWRLDATLVAGLAAAAALQLGYDRATPVIWLVALVTVAPLALRRTLPLAVCLVVLTGDLGMWALSGQLIGNAPVALAVYSAARYVRWPRSVVALVAAEAWVGGVLLTGRVHEWTNVLGAAPVIAGVWVIGLLVQRYRHQAALLRALADRLRREQAANARRAVADERARIARELHDTVSHHIASISVQAHAARVSLAGDAQRADTGLQRIAESAGSALADMRLLLAVLRPDASGEQGDGGGWAEAAPQPMVSDLDDLFDAARRSGLWLETTVACGLPELSGALQTCIYRLVQEALTNVVKHAGPVRVRVRLARGPAEVTVTIENEPGTPVGRIPGTGAGLAGLRTRAETLGGELHAGPAAGGGFRVQASLPIPNGATVG